MFLAVLSIKFKSIKNLTRSALPEEHALCKIVSKIIFIIKHY